MYKYFKGMEIVSEKKMLSGDEIASDYCLWKYTGEDSYKLKEPNGKLVELIIESFINKNNFKMSSYFYINENFAYKVFQEELAESAMNFLMQYFKENNIISDPMRVYDIGGIEFLYYEEEKPEAKIIDYQQFKYKKENGT